MNGKYELKKLPNPPDYHNSAGRLLKLLEMVRSQSPYYEAIALFYGQEKAPTEIKGELNIEFLEILSSAYREFLNDIEMDDYIPDPSKRVLKDGLANLVQIIYPVNMGNAPRQIQDAEIALLRMAASMFPQEDELLKEDKDRIAASIESLRVTVDRADLPKAVRTALLEVIRLSRNALEQFNIYGARGFRVAFKRMLSELMEIYLDQGPNEVVNKSWWKQALEHVKLIDGVGGKLLKYKPLLESVGTFFLSSKP